MTVFLNLFDLLPKIAPRRWSLPLSPHPPPKNLARTIFFTKMLYISVAHPIKSEQMANYRA